VPSRRAVGESLFTERSSKVTRRSSSGSVCATMALGIPPKRFAEAVPAVFLRRKSKRKRGWALAVVQKDRRAARGASRGAEPAGGWCGVIVTLPLPRRVPESGRIEAGKHLRDCRVFQPLQEVGQYANENLDEGSLALVPVLCLVEFRRPRDRRLLLSRRAIPWPTPREKRGSQERRVKAQESLYR